MVSFGICTKKITKNLSVWNAESFNKWKPLENLEPDDLLLLQGPENAVYFKDQHERQNPHTNRINLFFSKNLSSYEEVLDVDTKHLGASRHVSHTHLLESVHLLLC